MGRVKVETMRQKIARLKARKEEIKGTKKAKKVDKSFVSYAAKNWKIK